MPSLYLHIPFCERKCLYCDFYSVENFSPMAEFLEALHHEIDLRASYANNSTFDTIFFGGGTPSLLHPTQLELLLTHLHHTFSIADDAEITLETNPGTVTVEKLRAYRALGVNRLSIGVQSFHEDELRFLSRIHDRAEAIRCVESARVAGFGNLSIDLIFSLPGQDLFRWDSSLAQAVALETEHISAYSLIVEDNTPLARLVEGKQISPNPLETEAEMFNHTMAFLESHGFEHYEVSNYARPGFRSRHNHNYWNHQNYLGFGPSAHSFWKSPETMVGRRWWNQANISQYCDRLLQNQEPLGGQEFVRTQELMAERIFLGLRSDGVDLTQFEREFGVSLDENHSSTIQQLLEEDYAALDHRRLRLTARGFMVCDEISQRLLP
jgi:oxygen-independent coproporphyrinogen III oxidase